MSSTIQLSFFSSPLADHTDLWFKELAEDKMVCPVFTLPDLNRPPLQIDYSNLRSDFNRDGFAIVRNFLNQDELRELTTQTEFYLDSIDYDATFQTAAKKAFGGTIKNLQEANPWFNQQLRKGKPYRFIKELLESELKPATTAYFERIPGESRGIEPHFDAIGHRSWGATIWIALDAARNSNGCLHYERGSHRVEYPAKVGIEGFDKSTDNATPIEIDPGDAAIHSSLTVHWSNPNQSQSKRRAVSFFYWCT